MRGRQLITHFAAANLFDASVTAIGIGSVGVPEMSSIWGFLPQLSGEAFVLALKFWTTTSVLLAYILTREGRVRWGGYVVEKAIQLAMPVVYLASVWNLTQIGFEIVK